MNSQEFFKNQAGKAFQLAMANFNLGPDACLAIMEEQEAFSRSVLNNINERKKIDEYREAALKRSMRDKEEKEEGEMGEKERIKKAREEDLAKRMRCIEIWEERMEK